MGFSISSAADAWGIGNLGYDTSQISEIKDSIAVEYEDKSIFGEDYAAEGPETETEIPPALQEAIEIFLSEAESETESMTPEQMQEFVERFISEYDGEVSCDV